MKLSLESVKSNMKKLIEFILKNILPDKNFKVTQTLEGDITLFNIIVPKDFVGLVIGKEGRTIKSIRNICRIKATLDKTKVVVNVTEDLTSQR